MWVVFVVHIVYIYIELSITKFDRGRARALSLRLDHMLYMLCVFGYMLQVNIYVQGLYAFD